GGVGAASSVAGDDHRSIRTRTKAHAIRFSLGFDDPEILFRNKVRVNVDGGHAPARRGLSSSALHRILVSFALLQPSHRDRTVSDKLLLCQLDPLQKEVDIL